MDKGVYLPYSSRALVTPCIISLWIFCLVCLACIKIFKVGLLSILDMVFGNILFCVLLFAVIVLPLYYANHIFLFKNDKYKKYFAEFEKKKKYVQYYGVYVISIIIQFATFYILQAKINQDFGTTVYEKDY